MMEDADSVPSNENNCESISSTKMRPVTDQIKTDLDVVSSDDEFVSDNDSDLGFLSDDAADLSYLSATRTDNYSGLDITREGPEGPWIRLLRLQPGQYDDKLSGALIRRPLYEDGVQYVALSYSWKQGLRKNEEGKMPMSSLMLQYRAIEISEHLAHALRRLRKPRLTVYVWIDAICINQQDLGEKASQIPLMAQIYGNAANVYIWLGEPPPSSVTVSFFWVCTQDRPWWSRLWVVQECIYSTQCPIVLLGFRRMTFNQFVDRLSVTEILHGNRRLEIVNFLRGLHDAWSKHNLTNSTREPLLHRLQQTEILECEDFHDRAYALLSLIPERDAACLVVDYRKSNYNLAIEMTTALLAADEWTYGDLQLTWKSMMQFHKQSVGGRWDISGSRPEDTTPVRVADMMTAYEQMSSRELDNMCVEPIEKSQLVSFSELFDPSDLGDNQWLHSLFCNWWTVRLPAYDTQDIFQRLCHFYSRLPVAISDRHGVYEWTTSSGCCGFYFSPVQDMNAKIVFSMRGKTALVIDEKNGTYPGYVLRGSTKDTPSKQHRILLDFASPSIWDYEPPEWMDGDRVDGFNFSQSLSVTSAEPAEDDLAPRHHYVIRLKINSSGSDAEKRGEHGAPSSGSNADKRGEHRAPRGRSPAPESATGVPPHSLLKILREINLSEPSIE